MPDAGRSRPLKPNGRYEMGSKTRATYSISIPARIMRKLGWRKRQKVVVSEKRGRITIRDWHK